MRLQAPRIQMTIRQNYDRSTAMWKAVGTLSCKGTGTLHTSGTGKIRWAKAMAPDTFCGPSSVWLRAFDGEVLKVSIEQARR
jgi:hypothetical protein